MREYFEQNYFFNFDFNTFNFAIVNTDKCVDKFLQELNFDKLAISKLRTISIFFKIDFLKVDCEGGEYDIFTQDNLDFLINNVKKIVGEWHLRTPQLKEKFRNLIGSSNYLN
jgi:hypothetical protein